MNARKILVFVFVMLFVAGIINVFAQETLSDDLIELDSSQIIGSEEKPPELPKNDTQQNQPQTNQYSEPAPPAGTVKTSSGIETVPKYITKKTYNITKTTVVKEELSQDKFNDMDLDKYRELVNDATASRGPNDELVITMKKYPTYAHTVYCLIMQGKATITNDKKVHLLKTTKAADIEEVQQRRSYLLRGELVKLRNFVYTDIPKKFSTIEASVKGIASWLWFLGLWIIGVIAYLVWQFYKLRAKGVI